MIATIPAPVGGSYGLFQAKTRTLWIAPVAFDLGIGRQVFLHEAIHAAQSCPTRYHHGNRQLERAALSVQGHPDAIGRVIAALKQRCRLPLPASGANRPGP